MPDGTEPKKGLKTFKNVTVKGSAPSYPILTGTKPLIVDQFNQTRDYVNSPMYAKRLARMIATERSLPDASDASNKYKSELLEKYKTTQPIKNVVQAVVNNANANLDRVSDRTYAGNYDMGRGVIGAYDTASGKKDIRLNEFMLYEPENNYVPGHEFSHSAGDGKQVYSDAFKKEYVDKFMVSGKESKDPSFSAYVQEPTEIKARLDAIRNIAKSKRIYDAGKDVFTKEHLEKMKKDPRIVKDLNFQQLMDELKDSRQDNGFIWLMNNIAKNKSTPENNA